jgi:hypothetical protein
MLWICCGFAVYNLLYNKSATNRTSGSLSYGLQDIRLLARCRLGDGSHDVRRTRVPGEGRDACTSTKHLWTGDHPPTRKEAQLSFDRLILQSVGSLEKKHLVGYDCLPRLKKRQMHSTKSHSVVANIAHACSTTVRVLRHSVCMPSVTTLHFSIIIFDEV